MNPEPDSEGEREQAFGDLSRRGSGSGFEGCHCSCMGEREMAGVGDKLELEADGCVT